MPKLIPTNTLYLSPEYDAIQDAQWRTPQLPYPGTRSLRYHLPTSKPDLTVGYDKLYLKYSLAVDNLEPFSTPVVYRPELAFPSFCVQVIGVDDCYDVALRSRLNAAHMLRGLRALRKRLISQDGRVSLITM
ncbi:hypothetical protein SI65_08514 [Aspergillus cristatus]|uniref:Uncharacterized protein n=1 Tax=Aspergillus cristatus TaxID=573508 RepID=A0A1E3B541_ASPCR|nr:hypothetical protein SI65_08514 [Aspergillus cristatus]